MEGKNPQSIMTKYVDKTKESISQVFMAYIQYNIFIIVKVWSLKYL